MHDIAQSLDLGRFGVFKIAAGHLGGLDDIIAYLALRIGGD